VLTIEESSALFNAGGPDHLFSYLMMAFCTWARPEAITEFKMLGQTDYNRNIMHMNQPGRKQTKKFRPSLPIPKTLLPWLKKCKTNYFVSYKGKQIKSIKKSFASARKRAGLGSDVIPYTIRHTMATAMFEMDLPTDRIDLYLGHIPKGESKTYIHNSAKHLQCVADGIDLYFQKMQPMVEKPLVLPNPRVTRVSGSHKSE